MKKSKFMKMFLLGTCFTILSSSAALANTGGGQSASYPGQLPMDMVKKVKIQTDLLIDRFVDFSDTTVSNSISVSKMQPVRRVINEEILQKHREIDKYIFKDHAEIIEQKDFKVTHTGPNGDYVEIGITPFSEENANFFYEIFGREIVKVVEGQQARLLPQADTSIKIGEYEQALTNKDKEIEALNRQISKLEEALAAEDHAAAVESWAEGMKTRNGALQYAVMTSELKAELYEELAASGWTTGTSSPWIDKYELIEKGKIAQETVKYEVVFTYTDSTGSTSLMKNYITVTKQGEQWYVSDIEKEDTGTIINDDFAAEIEFEQGFYRPDYESLPEEIIDWVRYSQEIPAVQEKLYNGYRFVLITEGTKPTGGYGIEVEEVVEQSDKLEIKVNLTEPGENQMVTTALTHPYDLIIVKENELPLSFVDVDDPDRYFMNLVGIEEINTPIAAGSEWIKIFSPTPNEDVEGTINLTGLASVFEGTVSYELLRENNDVVDSGFTTAAMGDWGYFEGEIPVPADLNAELLTLQLYSESMKDGSKMFVVKVPLAV